MALSLVLLILVGCSTSENEAFMSDGTPGELAYGLRGRVLVKSDVSTIPDLPLEALVLALPSEAVGPLLAALGVEVESASAPARLGLTLPEELFEEYVAAHTRSSSDGTYALAIGPGRYWVCLADIGGDAAAPPPAHVDGCLDVTVPEGEAHVQDIYWGEAGVTAQ